ncbi:outer membrane beta-barrel protein [Gillisia sp. JM1]|uniref:outer membrane beta-barrel protein n=1 Tax=Gillisia sp. JM1 TaxID=1283286 RepID=UPI000404D876|nr:outer membrane beta-barrel protein [Gillisia sp. JM1]
MKKNIDDIFNEKFEQAEITPPEEIWGNISSQLPFKKQHKRIIPIWYLIAGTAAVLAIMILLFKNNNSPISNQKITNSPEKPVDKNNGDNPDVSKFQKSEPSSLFELRNHVVQTKIEKSESQNTKENEVKNITGKKSVISINNKKNTSSYAKGNELKNLEKESRTEESINSNYKLSKLIQDKIEIVANDSITQLEDNTIANVDDIEEPFNKKELEESLKTPMSKRLSVTTTAGALYFDNLSTGSGIDEQLANNNVNSEITTSYGINFGYQISKKLKIRTGISQIKLVTNTQNVAYSSILNSEAIEVSEFSSNPSEENGAPIFGKLNQNIGFIEIPSEVEYLILNKKFEINLIVGFSTLFLNENKISINTENSNDDLGKVNNLSDISFTANAGLGLSYKISPRFHFNLEPIFKYQLNTFKDTKDFRPYYIGMYSGFSFKF